MIEGLARRARSERRSLLTNRLCAPRKLKMRRSMRRGTAKKGRSTPLVSEVKPGSKKWGAILERLAELPFLAELSPQARSSLAHELELCRFDKGEAIVSEGDEADGVYVLHEGAATVEKNFECDSRRLSALLR